MNKKIIIGIVILLIVVAVVLAFVFMKKDENKIVESKVTSTEIQNKITETYGEEMSAMMNLDETTLNDLYKIDINKIDNFDIKIPLMNVRVDEIAILKLKDVKDVELVKQKLKERSEVAASNFERYLEDQYIIAKDPLIKSKGQYVIMVMSDRKDDIEKIFDSMLK